MRASRVVLIGVLVLASIVAACSAVSRVAALQPPLVTDYKVQQQVTPQFRSVQAPRIQLGIGLDFYTYPGQNVTLGAIKTIAYLRTLHANSISISFPFFMHGANASGVYGSNQTPSPAQLAIVAGFAERAGMYVSIRPLLDEASLGPRVYRTNWQPANPAAWFASYEKFLLPYAQMAQEADIPEFIDGAEFTYFGNSQFWTPLAATLRSVYKGNLVYDNNFSKFPTPMRGNGGAGVAEAVDAYHPLNLPDSASQAQVTAGWVAYDRTLPPGTVLLEVDIAAVTGAYLAPFSVTTLHPTQLLPYIQVRWFTGACDALPIAKLGGIYFWGVGLGQATNVPPNLKNPAGWVDSPGAVAVSDCFSSLAGT